MIRLSCWIYKSIRREEMYLYVPTEGDFSHVPAALLEHFGSPSFVMSLELWPERPLARARADAVINQLNEQGYYLQMPPETENLSPPQH